MSKKKLLEFGLKEADAFQKNFKIIFDRLVRGYKSMMGKEPEGLDLLKVKMEAREKALNTTKVVNQKGLTLDPDKPIMGGTQEGIPTIKTKFDEELDEFNLTKDDPMGDLEKIVKGEGDTGLPKKRFPRDVIDEEGIPDTMTQKDYDEGGIKSQMEDMFGVKLYGDETFDELMIIKNTGKHPRDMADGGKVPAAPSQLVSESDMILGYRGDDAYGGGRAGGPPGGPGESSSDAGFANTSPSRAGPVDMGFIDSGPTVNPNLAKKGPTLVGPGPTGEGPGPDYVMSTTPEPTLLDNIINAGTNIINNPITRTLGLATLTAINPTLAGKVRQGMMVKGMLDLAGDISLEDLTLGGGDVTGQTTALYKDGGLASMFVEKR